MDLVDYSQDVFEKIRNDYKEFAARLDLPDLHFIPISALKGDNVVEPAASMPWYQGSTLMNFLETVYIGSDRNLEDFRFPVQLVNRPHLDFRGFCGTIASGIIRQGDEVMALPSRKTSRIKSIVTFDGELSEAFAPQAVTVTLEDEIDVSRGDMLVRPGNVPRLEARFDAMVVWMSDEPLAIGKPYLFKHTTKMVTGAVSALRYRVDVNTLHRVETDATAIERDRPLQRDAEPAHRLRQLPAQSNDGRFYHRRSYHQQHRGRRHDHESRHRAGSSRPLGFGIGR